MGHSSAVSWPRPEKYSALTPKVLGLFHASLFRGPVPEPEVMKLAPPKSGEPEVAKV